MARCLVSAVSAMWLRVRRRWWRVRHRWFCRFCRRRRRGDEGGVRGPQEAFSGWPHVLEIRRMDFTPDHPFGVPGEVVAVIDDRGHEQVIELEGELHRVHVEWE